MAVWIRRTAWVLLALLAGGEALAAQDVVALPVAATIADGRPALALEVSDFSIRENGEAVRVERFEEASVPMNVAIVIDASPRQESRIEDTRRALAGLVDALDPAHAVTLIEAQTNSRILIPLTTDRERLRLAVGELESAERPTNRIIDATTEAFVTLLDTGNPRGAVVVVTDGIDVGSARNVEEFRRVLRLAGMPMYVLAVDNVSGYSGNVGAATGGPRASTQLRGALANLGASMERVYYQRREDWRNLAEESGGDFFAAADEQALSRFHTTLAGRLGGTYTFYYFSAGGTGLTPVEVEVRRSGVETHAPTGVWLPEPAGAN